ncbi:MAG TPA: hypothetical protein VK659_30300, partial [Asanoa sp.]|nr:hypothetical protein [Asanoa sp.]
AGRDAAFPAGRDAAFPAGRDAAFPATRDDAFLAGLADAFPTGLRDAFPAGSDDRFPGGPGWSVVFFPPPERFWLAGNSGLAVGRFVRSGGVDVGETEWSGGVWARLSGWFPVAVGVRGSLLRERRRRSACRRVRPQERWRSCSRRNCSPAGE